MMRSIPALRALVLLLAVAGNVAQAADRPRVGLVLGGGGARGAAHIGVLEVLEKHRIKVDCIAGTSMGALVAGGFAAGLTPAMMREELAKVDWHEMFLDNPDYSEQGYRYKKLSRTFIPGLEMGLTDKGVELPAGVVAGQKIRMFFMQLVRSELGERAIESLALPYVAVATDIGNGSKVVMRSGSLVGAMRASMSVPGLLAPVDLDGRKLVDGGLVDNVPIDEVRALCKPDVVIAVNVGSPLLKPDEVGSLLSVTAQMVNILTEQNVTRSLATLRAGDVYIKPDLEGITAADFDRFVETADRGRKAAEAAVERLKALSAGAEEYAAWWSKIAIGERKRPIVDEVRIAKLRDVNPGAVERYVRTRPGEPIDNEKVRQDVQRIFGDGYYEKVEYTLLPLRDRHILDITPLEKPWGPTYLRAGIGLQTERRDGSSYTLRAAYHRTWLNSLGAELLVSGEIGNRPAFAVDFYQPLDPAQRFFAEAYYSFNRHDQGIYQSNDRLAMYQTDVQRLGLHLGANVGVLGQVRLGWLKERKDTTLETGLPLLPGGHLDNRGWVASLDLDQFDQRWFPTKGWKSEVRYAKYTQVDYSRLDVNLEGAYTVGGIVFKGRFARSLNPDGGRLPAFDAAKLGGPNNLTAFSSNQILGGSSALYGVRAEKIIGRMPLGFQGDLRVGLGYERARMSDRYTETGLDGWLNAATVYLGGLTPVGPVFLVYSHSNNNNTSNLYLVIGTP